MSRNRLIKFIDIKLIGNFPGQSVDEIKNSVFYFDVFILEVQI